MEPLVCVRTMAAPKMEAISNARWAADSVLGCASSPIILVTNLKLKTVFDTMLESQKLLSVLECL